MMAGKVQGLALLVPGLRNPWYGACASRASPTCGGRGRLPELSIAKRWRPGEGLSGGRFFQAPLTPTLSHKGRGSPPSSSRVLGSNIKARLTLQRYWVLGACPDYRRWYDVTKVGRAWAARNEGVLGLLSCRGGHRGRRGQPQPL